MSELYNLWLATVKSGCSHIAVSNMLQTKDLSFATICRLHEYVGLEGRCRLEQQRVTECYDLRQNVDEDRPIES